MISIRRVDGVYECRGCAHVVGEHRGRHHRTTTAHGMFEHLRCHAAGGEQVPRDVLARLAGHAWAESEALAVETPQGPWRRTMTAVRLVLSGFTIAEAIEHCHAAHAAASERWAEVVAEAIMARCSQDALDNMVQQGGS